MKIPWKVENQIYSGGCRLRAIYAAITIPAGTYQLRTGSDKSAEALTVLPYFTIGCTRLFVGCILANIYNGNLMDIIFGSLASLIAAVLSRKMPKSWLVPLPPVVVNGLIIGWVLHIVEGYHIADCRHRNLGSGCCLLWPGYPLLLVLQKNKHKIFGTDARVFTV